MNALTRTLSTAFVALRRNVLRSALTCLGIIIGVAAVIAMMEIGTGSSAAIQQRIASMGANTLLVLPGTAASGGVSWGTGSVLTLTPGDAEAVLAQCPAVTDVAPAVRARSSQVVYGNRNWIPATIQGTTPAFLDVRDWSDLADGDMFTDADVRNASKVCVLGQTLVRELFEGQSPVGKELRIANVTFRVVGVLAWKGASMMGADQDDIILAPWTTVKYRVTGQSSGGAAQSSSASGSSTSGTSTSSNGLYPGTSQQLYPQQSDAQAQDSPKPVRFTNIDQILVGFAPGRADAANEQITALLRERHRLRRGEPDDFQIRNMTEISQMLSSTTAVMTNLLLCIAAISLVVGGVGIMNIMLVSVTERTREIGLRMAVGARGADILRQFLTEAVVLCLLGGTIGILIGRGGSLLVRALLHWPTKISVPAIVAAVVVSVSVGVVFGYYPAWKASRLDPIEALRYE